MENYNLCFYYSKPFFEKRGYKVVKERQVERQGIFSYKLCDDKGTINLEFINRKGIYEKISLFIAN